MNYNIELNNKKFKSKMNIPYLITVLIFILITMIVSALLIIICFQIRAKKRLKNWFQMNKIPQTNSDSFGHIESLKSKLKIKNSKSKSISHKLTANIRTNRTTSNTQTFPDFTIDSNSLKKPINLDHSSTTSNAKINKKHSPMITSFTPNVDVITLMPNSTSKKNKNKSTAFKVNKNDSNY